MIITIYEGYDKSYVLLGSKDERFRKEWGNVVRIPVLNIRTDLSNITNWCNNELGEECLFEVD